MVAGSIKFLKKLSGKKCIEYSRMRMVLSVLVTPSNVCFIA